MSITKAYFLKLGSSGKWEEDSISTGKIRFGWNDVPLEMLNRQDWDTIRKVIEDDFTNRKMKTGATNDFNALRSICLSNEETIFITFSSGKMYWCVPKNGPIKQDEKSKYREAKGGWSNKDIFAKRLFETHQLSGKLTKYQAFLGTCCSIGNELKEFEYLVTIIEGNDTSEYLRLVDARRNTTEALIPAIKNLTPKDFEVLIDLIFRNAGWKRTSVLGEVMKFVDIVLEEPIHRTVQGQKNIHGVQIKSKSSLEEYRKYAHTFLSEYKDIFQSFFFVVHTPDRGLDSHFEEAESIRIIKAPEIADLCLENGLLSWVMEKSR